MSDGLAPFRCSNPPDAAERERLEAEAREIARERWREYGGDLLMAGGFLFTDGLGALGCGSWDDGPASIQNAAFQAEIRELAAQPSR